MSRSLILEVRVQGMEREFGVPKRVLKREESRVYGMRKYQWFTEGVEEIVKTLSIEDECR